MTVDPEFARWLREGAIFAPAEDAAISAAWGDLAQETEILTPLALQADAENEGARQIAFLGGPLAVEEHDVTGLRHDLFGRSVTIVADRLGYQGGITVFVIGVAEHEELLLTKLTVLRRLA